MVIEELLQLSSDLQQSNVQQVELWGWRFTKPQVQEQFLMLTTDMTQTTACKTRCIQQNIYGPCGSGNFNRQQIWACPVFSSLVSGRLRCFNLLVCRSTLMSQPAGSFQRITKQVIRSDQQNQGHSAVSDSDRRDTIITDKPGPPVRP